MLDALRAGGMRTAILSNGSREMLDAAVASAGVGTRLDAVLSVDDVRVYKPHPDVYRLACDRLGVGREAVCFLSSNAWDAAGAATFGFRVVWVNRFGPGPRAAPRRPRRRGRDPRPASHSRPRLRRVHTTWLCTRLQEVRIPGSGLPARDLGKRPARAENGAKSGRRLREGQE